MELGREKLGDPSVPVMTFMTAFGGGPFTILAPGGRTPLTGIPGGIGPPGAGTDLGPTTIPSGSVTDMPACVTDISGVALPSPDSSLATALAALLLRLRICRGSMWLKLFLIPLSMAAADADKTTNEASGRLAEESRTNGAGCGARQIGGVRKELGGEGRNMQ